MQKTVATLTTAQLVRRCQASSPDRGAFAELLRRHHSHVDRLVYCLAPNYPHRAALLQDVWVQVYDHINELTVPADFRSWVSQFTARWVIAKLRLSPSRSPLGAKLTQAVKGWSPWKHQVAATLTPTMIAELPDEIRTTMLLRDMGGFCYDAIADITNVTTATVKARLAQARQHLV